MAHGQLKSLIGSIRRKPSTAPDHKTNGEATALPNGEKTSIKHDLLHLKVKDVKMLGEGLTTLASGEPLDDKELLLEHGVSMLQTLPLDSGLSATVSEQFIKMLYNDLPHPPATNAGPTARYRRHDGGGNNPWNPEMGKAGTPYSRSVPVSFVLSLLGWQHLTDVSLSNLKAPIYLTQPLFSSNYSDAKENFASIPLG